MPSSLRTSASQPDSSKLYTVSVEPRSKAAMDGVLPVLSGTEASPPHLAINAEQILASPDPAQAAKSAVEFWIRLLRSGARASKQ